MPGVTEKPYIIKQDDKMDYRNLKVSISNMITEKSLKQSCQVFESVIQQLKNYKRIFIYGAGGWGISLQKLLKVYSIGIHAFFDRRADEIDMINKVPVFNLDQYNATENDKKESLIIIAVRLEIQKSIEDNLKERGYINCITINGIWHYGCWSSKNELFSLIHEKEKILKCSDIWADQKSLDIYYRHIKCYISRLYKGSIQIDRDQYFPDDIMFGKGYSKFVDCGAYIGDTVDSLIENIGKITHLIAIEADVENFKELTSKIKNKKKYIAEEIYTYPCGIWSSTKMLAFDNTQGPSCHISESGNAFLQCVSLDDILPDFIPTFIKMDIEGAEIEAIKGARYTISKFKPDLAIAVYHKIEHLWEVPLLIKSLKNNYKFYLRSYEHFNQETVLYAV
jgi:FkbM family methyltransferase